MPIVSVVLTLESSWDVIVEKRITLKPDNDDSITVRRNEEYTLTVGLKRQKNSRTLKAHCPMFLKGKDESWFLILGDIENRELWALKRVSGINSQQRYHQLQFTAPNSLGKLANVSVMCVPYLYEFLEIKILIFILGPTKLTFYLISDCYIGLDQQYSICLDVTC